MKQPQITHVPMADGEHKAIIEVRWWAMSGTFLVEAVGYGNSPEAAETSARLMLGQARAKLNEVTAKETVA